MIRFESDYTEGAHPNILTKLVSTNMEQTIGYGEDHYCEQARELIKGACGNNELAVHFLVGGTQTNTTVISSVLRPYQGALSAVTGHINCHETGAIEATGHKVLPLASEDGKITAKQVRDYYDEHWADSSHEHVVQPGMVYISHPTENGTTYHKEELVELYNTCKELELPLFIDGARLGYALASEGNDLSLEDIAANCDVFYIGGTKVGALFGEAVVISNKAIQKDFRYNIKLRGGMFAKGRLLGLQFETLFTDNLYQEISEHAITQAMRIRDAFAKKGYHFLYDSRTNQQFPILPVSLLDFLGEKYSYSFWTKVDDTHNAVRFCTSWATKEENVDALLADIEEFHK
ncbi:MAG TPA: low specificity L-threonine aldolase [Lachnoclostridium phytofermentans]|uniref:Low specificity L-threonine aldolase n=1 Tax=Lachnoclostridium phytofermentans TaxID=66219 RepID=A0A3D2XA15_9FIRM|nr:beta-eliminating lyase-related protein [Lachnoclostridium sp.]HCL03962.1 low specificity L-threonine aldolase [Lachnoclostridium phytofermentans]